MRRKLTILLLTLLVFIVSMSLIACKGDEELLATNGQVPVYQGMTISGNNTINNLSPRMAPDENASDVAKYIHGDHTGRDEDIDQETPFEEVPTIEQKAESTLVVNGSGAEIYYASKNQDIYITIKVLNPDSYEIVSFTLNGNKYTSYMFEAGSDLENLILKLNVGEAAGIVDYTIDAIKYIDGTEIKDVLIEGEKTVKAGVRANDQTYVNVTNSASTLNTISFNANLVDLYDLIAKSEGYAKAVLYDGVSIVSTKDITAGENSVVFDSLSPNKLYQYGITVLYDNLSGDGIQLNTIYTCAIYTKTIVLFDNISVSQTGISFDYLWEETFENKKITNLALYRAGEKVSEPSSTALSLSNLLSNVEYEIRASYLNLSQETETISVFFTTAPKATPIISITNPDSTQTSVSFEITETDTDSVGEITKIELIHGTDMPIEASTLDVRTFSDLLSNNLYTVKVTYTYDLNDGVGSQALTMNQSATTVAKATPTVVIDNVVPTQTSIGFGITVTDVDQVGAVSAIELYKGETLVEALTDLSVREFTGLLSNNEYTIKVTYTYDSNDGTGEKLLSEELTFSTLPKDILINTISVLNQQVTSGDTVVFSVNVSNPDSAIVKSVIFNGNEIVLDLTSTTTTLRFRLKIEDEMGIANYLIESFILNNGNILSVSENNAVEFFVMADIYVVEVNQADGNLYGNMNDSYRVTFNQPISSYIQKVVANGVNPTNQVVNIESIIIVDNYTIEIPITSMYNIGMRKFKIASIEFQVDSVSYSVNFDHEFIVFIVNNGVNYIKTIDDLLAMNPLTSELFILNNDIDFTGVNWSTMDFNGVLLGNGYKFTNITIIDYSSTQRSNFAIFDTINGVIDNLVIENVFISIDKNNPVKASGLVITNNGIINNVNITGNIEVVTTGESQIGGVVAYNYGHISNTHFDGIINVKLTSTSNSMLYVGGIAAFSKSSFLSANISSSSVTSLIMVDSVSQDSAMIGGIVGRNQDNSTIANVLSNSVINVTTAIPNNTTYVGGLVGYNYNSSVYYSISIGEIILVTDSSHIAVGGISGGVMWSNYFSSISFVYYIDKIALIGNKSETDVIENSYIYDIYALHDIEKISIIDLNNKDFFILTLQWSEKYWNFDDLDFLNGVFPKLK